MPDDAQPNRWIYTFRRTDRRELTEEERARLRRLARRQSRHRFQWGCLALLCGLAGLLGICIAASMAPWGWAVAILGFVGLFWMLSIASAREYLSLLYRRAFRLGRVDVYTRVSRPSTLGPDAPNAAAYAKAAYPIDGQWAADERFEEKIAKQAGMQPNGFETPIDDAVLITVEGRIVSRVIDAGKPEQFDESDERPTH